MNCPFCFHENIQIICPSCGWSTHDASEDLKLPEYEMVSITPNEFWMGSPISEEGRDPDENLHLVLLTRKFQIGKTEVSQEIYEAIMDTNPSQFKGSNHPVENISWEDAIHFCNKYSEMSGLEQAYTWLEGSIFCNFNANGYRLPTEAEWEFVAKSYSTDQKDDHDQALHFETNPVSTENAEISELLGNVWEFCWDFYGPYPTQKTTDPTGAPSSPYRVIRGGSWVDGRRIRRASNRAFVSPDHRSETIGFRLAKTIT